MSKELVEELRGIYNCRIPAFVHQIQNVRHSWENNWVISNIHVLATAEHVRDHPPLAILPFLGNNEKRSIHKDHHVIIVKKTQYLQFKELINKHSGYCLLFLVHVHIWLKIRFWEFEEVHPISLSESGPMLFGELPPEEIHLFWRGTFSIIVVLLNGQ
jgi:hypothetical protein